MTSISAVICQSGAIASFSPLIPRPLVGDVHPSCSLRPFDLNQEQLDWLPKSRRAPRQHHIRSYASSVCTCSQKMVDAVRSDKRRRHSSLQRRVMAAAAGDGSGVSVSNSMEEVVRDATEANASSSGTLDVSSNCVTPVFRSTPWTVDINDNDDNISADKVNILFLSEGNVCRSVYAEAIFQSMLKSEGLDGEVACTSKATRNYNVGESPDDRAMAVAPELNLTLRDGCVSRMFDNARDIVLYDLVVVMDKFNAADVLKEVSVYDTINKDGHYSIRVRRLGEFCRLREVVDIDDPLYGNMGGPEEEQLLKQVYEDVRDSCEGLLERIQEIRENLGQEMTLKEGVARFLQQMEALDWLVPPMLQKRK